MHSEEPIAKYQFRLLIETPPLGSAMRRGHRGDKTEASGLGKETLFLVIHSGVVGETLELVLAD
jgi:hypothetical protein